MHSVTLHSVFTKNRFQTIDYSCAKIKPCTNLFHNLRNKNQVDIFQRTTKNHQAIVKQNGILTELRSNADPYMRLVRFDRPIGEH